MKRKVSSSLFIDRKPTKNIIDLIIQATSKEFNLSEEEINSCVVNYIKHHRKDYPPVETDFSISKNKYL